MHPWGSSEPSPAESGAARKKRLISMVRQLSQQPRQSIQFQEIERAVSQLGGTIKTNGQDSHYLMRLNHIDTGHLVLGATLKKKARGNEYPWWINTAVDALERAVGLVTEDMSRIFEKVHQ